MGHTVNEAITWDAMKLMWRHFNANVRHIHVVMEARKSGWYFADDILVSIFVHEKVKSVVRKKGSSLYRPTEVVDVDTFALIRNTKQNGDNGYYSYNGTEKLLHPTVYVGSSYFCLSL